MAEEASSSAQGTAVEEDAITLRDFVDFLSFIFAPSKIIRWLGRILIFILIGYFTKLWMWFSMCVLELEGLPCREDYRLLSMPFPIELGFLYFWLVPSATTSIVYSRGFFAVDYVHFLCGVQGVTVLLVIYAFYRSLRWILVGIFSKCRTRVRSVLMQAREHRRRKLHESDQVSYLEKMK